MVSAVYICIKSSIQKSRKFLHDYWKNPNDGNDPYNYVNGQIRTDFLFGVLCNLTSIKKSDSIMEIGCNVGRNLNKLHKSGYINLYGIEISSKALTVMKEVFPDLYDTSEIKNESIENAIVKLQPKSIDWIFTMACLEHVHYDSDWVFEKIASTSSKGIVTIEDEYRITIRHFPRNYQDVFNKFGFTQTSCINCKDIRGLDEKFNCRILKAEIPFI